MSKHTDGPWQLVEKFHTSGVCPDQPHLEYFHLQGPLGDLDSNLNIAGFMKRADAKLIAAAPELLEALQAAIAVDEETIIGGTGCDTYSARYSAAREKARAAIAKATR